MLRTLFLKAVVTRVKAEEIVATLLPVDVLRMQEKSIAEAAETIAVTEKTYPHCRAKFRNMKNGEIKRLEEVARL